MKFRLALFVGLLCATLVYSLDTTVTTEATTAVTSPAATAASTAPSAGTSGAPATSPASPNTSGSPGTTVTGGTTVSGGSTKAAASTVTLAPAVSTEAGSTVSSAPTTLPVVSFSLVQFGSPVCVNALCTYEIDAPVNNQAVLGTDDSIIATDRTVFGGLQSAASAKDAAVKKANDDAVTKIQKIQAMIDQIQSQLDQIQNMTQTIKAQQDTATYTILLVENFISGIGKDSCLWQRCLKPTTPAPPTTTPTPAPTTTPNPCIAFDCSRALSSNCSLTSTNQPFCTKCPGDMDGLTGCTTVACPATITPFNTDTDNSGTWYSVGYNSTSETSSKVPASSNCVYQLNGTFSVTSQDDLKLGCLTSKNVQITFYSSDGGFSQPIANNTNKRALDNLLKKVPGGTILLTSSVADTSFCQIPLTKLPDSSASFEEEGEVPAKKNGFFSWLMGY